ncbi:MAG: prenyltransferase/squalene oxidase repeat-containing protein, partial [Candidatus Thorarchaeota archaeon]
MNKIKVLAIAFAFTLMLVVSSAQPVAAASRYDTLSSYMSDNYDAIRGGYFLPFDGVTRVTPTYGALSIMEEVGTLAQRPPQISITMVMEFSENHQWLTGDEDEESSFGGFSNYLLAVVTNEVNYHGLLLWQTLKSSALSDIPGVDDYEINVTANAFWINKTLSEAGGYSDFKESNENMIATYYALASYRIIQNMYPLENAWNTYVNETAVLAWIESCRDGDSYKLSPESSRTSVSATAAAILAYEAIDPASTIPGVAGVQSWLLDRQVSDYQEPEYIGGFEEGNATDEPNIVSTYFAMSALNSMN